MRCCGCLCARSWLLLQLTFVLSLWVNLVPLVCAFNFSPQPNLIIEDPKLKTLKPQTRSSLFGYTMVMRPNSIFIGAPRAQSTLESQRNINETGALYRCSLQEPSTCNPYVLESNGNIIIEHSDYTYDSEKRDFQWFGGAMDGGTKDTDKLIVCAPKFIAPSYQDYLMHGICYWVNDTLNEKPGLINRIMPLRLKTEQVKKDENGLLYYYYTYAEQGFSAHITADNREFLIGAPGLHTWKGSVIRYMQRELESDPSLSRRDTSAKRVTRQSEMFQKTVYMWDVLNPANWDQPNDSYFGYSVSSGYFDSENPTRMLYVATAPQAHSQDGEAYLFDINGTTITRYFVFRGTKFGEYFGYAVLAEDVNNDGLTDVIISAPQHSVNGLNEEGAIYVYVNQGKFNFERKLLFSPVQGKARFGTTLSNLGDINKDGYNDIAVGAPFAGNGSVFIFLGNEKGVRDRTSQRLDSPPTLKTRFGGLNLYGHGLSKGSDYDGNGFNDLGVGAPNAEAVMIYRAYPVVKIVATVSSKTREIKPEQGRFQIKACYSIATTSPIISSQELALRVVADPQVKRVRLLNGTFNNEAKFTDVAGLQPKCRTLDAEVRFSVADIFKPIELEIHYNLVKTVPDSEIFCDTCAAVDPDEPKVFIEKIIFSTGCASEICIADLQVKSLNPQNSFILGSSNTLKISYEISNSGETAYLPQINITSSNRMPFAKIPSNCKVEHDVILLCDLYNGRPMSKGSKALLDVLFDSSGIGGKEIIITTEAYSTGREKTPNNNKLRDIITLKEFTDIEVIGVPSTPHINLEKMTNTTQIVNNYEIKSLGPSAIGALEVVFMIPVAYRLAGSTATIPIIDEQNISMQAVYDAQLVNIDYYENKTQILMNAIEYQSSAMRSIQLDSKPKEKLQIGQVNVNEINAMSARSSSSISAAAPAELSQMPTPRRRRRDVATNAHPATNAQYARITQFSQQEAHNLLTEDLKGTLPVNRTIVFNCQNPETTVCVRAVLRVYNFKPEKPITINLKYLIDLNEVNQILIEPWEFFVILVGLDIKKVGSDSLHDADSLAISQKIEYNIISKHQLYGTPLWVYILAILGGLLILSLITFGMYKLGFFKRTTKEEMEQLVHQNKIAGDEVPETANLNSENN